MAKGKSETHTRPKALPVCTAMLICEQVLIGKDDVISAIRIIDTITIPNKESLKTDVGQEIEFPGLTLLVMLKNGDAKGKYDLVLVCADPSGEKTPVALAPGTNFDGPPETGRNLHIPLRLTWREGGLYWIELVVDGTTLSRTPFGVKLSETSKPEKSGKKRTM